MSRAVCRLQERSNTASQLLVTYENVHPRIHDTLPCIMHHIDFQPFLPHQPSFSQQHVQSFVTMHPARAYSPSLVARILALYEERHDTKHSCSSYRPLCTSGLQSNILHAGDLTH